MPKLEDFIAQNGDSTTPSSINNNTGRTGTRLATRNERTPGAETGQSHEMQDLMLRNAQDRWKMSYSRYLIRMETISDYDIKMMKTITNAIHRNVKNYLEPHERYMKAIVEKNPGEILSCIATLLHSTMISHSTTAAGIAALCKQFDYQRTLIHPKHALIAISVEALTETSLQPDPNITKLTQLITVFGSH